MKHALDWDAIALAGDCGAVAERPRVADAPRFRLPMPGRTTALLLAAWLLWEVGGAVRAVLVGYPILSAMWRLM